MIKSLINVGLISFLITSVWFNTGKMLAHAEEGLPFYSPARILRLYSSVWQNLGLGAANPFVLPRIPLFAFSSWLSAVGVSTVLIQQLIFTALLIFPFIFVPLLTKELLPDSKKMTHFYSAMFYIFNLFVLSQVFHRFIYSLIFLWSYLPTFLYLWIKWLESKRLKYLLFFLLSSVIFSNIFVLVSSVFALWIPAGIIWFRYKKILPAFVAIGLWLLSTVWWWYPLTLSKNNPYEQSLNFSQNFTSLVDVSKFYPSSEIFLLKQQYFFGPKTIWADFFSSPSINFISIGLVLLVCLGALFLIKFNKSKLLIIWMILGWFLVKGANPPWGIEFYSWLFRTFPFTMVLRNPYEKMGVIFLLPYCILAAIGLSRVPSKIVRTLVIFVICFALLRPMWTGQVFSGYQVQVPEDYKIANDYLNTTSKNRVLSLPFLHSSGITTSWGYAGDEPSEYLFDRVFVSKTYNNDGDAYSYIYKYLKTPEFSKILNLFNIDSIVLHKDLLKNEWIYENYETTKNILDKDINLKLDKAYPSMDIYTVKNGNSQWGYLSKSANLTKVLPEYVVEKITPSHYKYIIKNAAEPYVLILSVLFNEGWTISANGKPIMADHFQVNGYANGWLVGKQGDYVVDIIFKVWPWE